MLCKLSGCFPGGDPGHDCQHQEADDLAERDEPPPSISVGLFTKEYDDDARELWQIPEAKSYFRKLIDEGWYGVALHAGFYDIKTDLEAVDDCERQNFFWMPIAAAYSDERGLVDRRQHMETVRASCLVFDLSGAQNMGPKRSESSWRSERDTQREKKRV